MKKRVLLLAAILAIVAVIAATLCACDPTEQQTGAQLLQQQYNDISLAKEIEQKIEITKGEFTQFASEKTYTKTEDGYSVTGTEKRLNDADPDADELYDTTEIDEAYQKAVDGKPALKLDEQYFEAGFRLSETGLTANVKQANIKDVFGITGELTAPTDNLMLEMSVSGGRLSTVRINYDSNGSHVTITLTMTY